MKKRIANAIFCLLSICVVGLVAQTKCWAQGISGLFGPPSASDLLKRKSFNWKSDASEHLRFHFEANSYAERQLSSLKSQQEQALSKILRLLGAPTYPHTIDVFVLDSRARMKALIGREPNAIAFPKSNVVCFIYNTEINASGAHEMMHVIARNSWKGDPASWLNEGLAVYADDMWHRYSLHDVSKYMLLNSRLVPLERLMKDFREHNALISYPQAGSFVKYLYERHGMEKVKELWGRKTSDMPRTFGKDLEALEKGWHARLAEADATKVRYKLP